MGDLQANRSPEIVSLMVAFLAVAWTLVALRFYTRIWVRKCIGADDWVIIAAVCSYSVYGGFVFASVHHGLGRHDSALTPSQDMKARMYYSLSAIGYITAMALVKISIALLILRIVVERRYKYMIIISMALVALWSLAEGLYTLFQCRPVQFQWDFTIEGGFCTGNAIGAALAFSVMSIVSDWFYALLPIPLLWPLKINLQTKISTGLILSLGLIASVSPFIRIKYLLKITRSNSGDFLYANTDAIVWTIVEPGIAISTASMATLRPLLAGWNVPGFRRSAITMSGTTGNEGEYINFESWHSATCNSVSTLRQEAPANRAPKTHDYNGSEEVISHGEIVKSIEAAVIRNGGYGV